MRYLDFVVALARRLQPAVVVIEDVDLVAEDRSFSDASPLLFALLDAMDGLAPDADVSFVLTTNRAEVLEQALAARPGRVDLAVEIPLPDATGRERLLRLCAELARRRGPYPGHRRDRRGHRLLHQGTDAPRRARRTSRRTASAGPHRHPFRRGTDRDARAAAHPDHPRRPDQHRAARSPAPHPSLRLTFRPRTLHFWRKISARRKKKGRKSTFCFRRASKFRLNSHSAA